MSGYTVYGGIQCQCPNCGAKVSRNDARMLILWANQHGAAIRIFCEDCFQWSDRKLVNGKDEVIRVVRPPVLKNAGELLNEPKP